MGDYRMKGDEHLIVSAIDMYESLNMATREAGGIGWTIAELNTMTVVELIASLAPNHVVFMYVGPNLKKED